MPRKANVLPSYLRHKQNGQARVRINGHDHLLGPFGSESSRLRYGELIAQSAGGCPVDPIASSNRGRLPRNADPGPSVAEICLVFLRHAESHYLKNGRQTSEIYVVKSAMRPLTELYALLPAAEFGPLALKAVRAKMIDTGWARKTINAAVSRIRRVFKHAIANELIDSGIEMLQVPRTVVPLIFLS